MKIFNNILETVGNTPIVKIRRMDTGVCDLYLKLENQNPSGSIKDRIAVSMIDAAEKNGSIEPGGEIIEATAGNTGLGLALVASIRNYRLTLVIPDKMSSEKIRRLSSMGANIVITRSDVEKGHPEYYQDLAAWRGNAARITSISLTIPPIQERMKPEQVRRFGNKPAATSIRLS